MKKRVLRRAADDPDLLADLLAARLGLTLEAAIDFVDRGCVYVDTARVTTSRRKLAVGDKVTVYLRPAAPPAPPPLAVVYRDPDVAIVDKPAGLPSQGERGQNAYCLEATVRLDLGVEARLMHRLDKETSGLVLVALRDRVYAPLQKAIVDHEVDRRYIAIVDGDLRAEGTIRKRIGRHPRDQRLRAPFPEDSTTGEAASTHYHALAHGTRDGRPVTAIELRLETGRTHQIRVHLSSIDHPIVGDTAYGGPAFERMCLHAYLIELPNPGDGRRIRASSHLPDSFARIVPGLTSPFT